MSAFVHSLVQQLAQHPWLAYAAVLLLALSESLPVIGMFVPGTAVILAISALVPSGVVTLWPLLVAATVGAILGDGFAYGLGRRYQRQIVDGWLPRRYPTLFARSEAFFARHGDKSVFLARFVPGVRAVVPLMAGVLGMTVRRFTTANVASALVWAPSHILPGVLVGASFGLFGPAAGPLAILIVLLVLLIWTVYAALRLALRHGVPALQRLLSHWHTRARTRDTLVARSMTRLLDPAQPEGRVLLALALVMIGAAWMFGGILEDLITGDPLVQADTAVYGLLQELRTAPGDNIMVTITELGDATVVIAVALAVLLWFVHMRAWRTAGYWTGAIVGATAINTAIKAALHRPRPIGSLYDGAAGFSFPSGHSTLNLVLYGFLAFLVIREIRPTRRLPIALGATTLILAIAFSRLYLGAHWFSDVAGGLAFGTAWLILLWIGYTYGVTSRIAPRGLLLVAGATFVVAGSVSVVRSHAGDVQRYAYLRPVPTIGETSWRNGDWRKLPVRRTGITGEPEEPMTLQWAGEPRVLADALATRGWQPSALWTVAGIANWWTTPIKATALPLLPSLAAGEFPALVRIQSGATPDTRLVLRLWEADVALIDATAATTPLFVGSIVEERVVRLLALLPWLVVSENVDGPRDAFAAATGITPSDKRRGQLSSGWDGRILRITRADLN